MKLIQINTVCDGSTGRIMRDIQRAAIDEGLLTYSLYGRRKGLSDLPCVRFGDFFSFWTHVGISTLLDMQGTGSFFHTRRMVEFLRREKPDIIHLHNLHGYYINLKELFDYLSNEYDGKVIWTFHDCWPITGHCAFFSSLGCCKWQTKCHNCPKKHEYPVSIGPDMSSYNYSVKKELFSSLKNLTVICPSEWMKKVLKESFLSEMDVRVIHNGIDTGVFRPMEPVQKIGDVDISGKKVILGVARIWEKRKGLNDIISIAERIGDEYLVVLVGKINGFIKEMPSNVVRLGRIDDVKELAGLYSSADVFVNPSKEESFSLVTVEALSCGTPAVVLDSSAVCEFINDHNGIVLHDPTTEDYICAIKSIVKDSKKISESVSGYTTKRMTEEVIKLYRETQ